MQHFNANHLLEIYSAAIPLSLLLVESERDRQFLTGIYLDYRSLMYKIAAYYFPGNHSEIDDAIGTIIERLCKKYLTLKELECNKLPSYIVCTSRRVCLNRIRELMRQRQTHDYTVDFETVNSIPDEKDVYAALFIDLTGHETLAAFPELSDKDRDLILMRHVELLGYDEIAAMLGITEGNARTAVSRAKSRLIKLAKLKKWKGANEQEA